MKTVLIVDDERPFLLSLRDGLAAYGSKFSVATAGNGQEALSVLASGAIDLVVTDLSMPVMNGFELLAHMSQLCPNVPVIVMTALAPPEVRTRLKAFHPAEIVEKPVAYTVLGDLIVDALAATSRGHIQGITLPTFLQLVAMERLTCTLRVASAGGAGVFFFRKGELIDAESGALHGNAAALAMTGWDDVAIEIESTCDRKDRRIGLSLPEVLMEGLRLKDEQALCEGGPPEDIGSDAIAAQSQKRIFDTRQEHVMALEQHLQSLREVKGYKASGIMDYTGEILAFDSVDSQIDLLLVGATFNDIFRSAHEASRKIGLDACRETVINTPRGIVIMRCSGADSLPHLHFIGIVAADGNHALMKMLIEKLVPAITMQFA